MLPSYNNGKWDHTELVLPPENHTEMRFPDENYNYDEMAKKHVFIGAYDGDECIGLGRGGHVHMNRKYIGKVNDCEAWETTSKEHTITMVKIGGGICVMGTCASVLGVSMH